MKKLLLFSCVFILSSFSIYPQWFWQNPLPQGNTLLSVKFISSTAGWAVGQDGTILRTTNGGTTWIPQTSGTTEWLNSVHFTDNNTGWTVGDGGTILKTTNGGVKVINTSTEVPSKYFLEQNYPNPFNPTTQIRFDIKQSSYAKLIVYDILGKEISTLVNEKLSAGSYEVNWNGSGYPSGVYFYKLITDGYSDVKKMILNK